eukprot:Gb_31922 [translate_table: standard]
MEVQQVCKDLQIGGVEGEAAMTVDIQEGKSAKDGKPSLGNQEPVLESSGEGMAVLDFDVLCATVAMQSEGLSFEIRSLSGRESGGGVQRMWEGGLLDCLDNREISLRTACCPCSTFGKNVQRAGFGTCFGQGTVHFLLGTCALISYIAFGVTKLHALLYIALAFTLSLAVYAGYFRTQIRKRFNIKGSDNALHDCVHHLLCSCCTLCQEARTLEMNNVQDGIWHGRGDTVLVGSYKESHNSSQDLEQPTVLTTSPAECIMNKEDHAWNRLSDQSEPLVGSKL